MKQFVSGIHDNVMPSGIPRRQPMPQDQLLKQRMVAQALRTEQPSAAQGLSPAKYPKQNKGL